MSSYSLHFLPEEDRLLLSFKYENEKVPGLLLTRRMTKLICFHLKNIMEKNNPQVPAAMQHKNAEIAKFEHQNAVEQADINRNEQPQKISIKPGDIALPTKININPAESVIVLTFFQKNKFLVRLSLGRPQVHCLLHAMAEMSVKADWQLESVMPWLAKEQSDSLSDNEINYIN